MSAHTDTAERLRSYQRLARRNRIVAVLRIAVPAAGLVVLVGLVGQIYLSSLGGRFGVGQITVTREAINVDAPEYAGVLDNGSRYQVSASAARASLEATDMIMLSDVRLNVIRANGVTIDVTSAAAQLDTTKELVIIAGPAYVTESTGTTSVFTDSVFDWQAQILTGTGPVSVDYADGTHLEATGLVYQAQSMIWTFSDATVTLPRTPGAQTP